MSVCTDKVGKAVLCAEDPCGSLIPSICGNTMPIHYIDCYAFQLETMMGEVLGNADTTTDTKGTEGIRNFNNHKTIICLDGNGKEVEVPFHAVKTFDYAIITDVEGEKVLVKPDSKCLTTTLDIPKNPPCESC